MSVIGNDPPSFYPPLQTIVPTYLNETALVPKMEAVAIISNEAASASLTANIKQIPSNCLKIALDNKWMAIVNDLFGAASNICSLIGTASEAVPFLSIISAPVYLPHAIKEARARLKLMATACKTSRVADAFFWGGRGIGSVGIAVSDIIKPFAFFATLLGFVHIHAVGLTFSFIIPIILIAFSVIGGAFQGWALGRSAKALHKFNQKREELDGTLENLEELLRYLSRPSKGATLEEVLKEKTFSDSYFTYHVRKQMVQKRIETLLSHEGESSIRSVQKAIELCDRMLSLAGKWQSQERSIQEMVPELEKGRQELLDAKETLYEEGLDITNAIHGEVKRRVLEQVTNVLAAVMSLIAAILILTLPNHTTIVYGLSLSSAALRVGNGIFNKCVSERQFQPIEPFKLLEQHKVAVLDTN